MSHSNNESQVDTQPSSQQIDPVMTQPEELTNIDDINYKTFDRYTLESIFNIIQGYKCRTKCARALAAIIKDYEVQQYLMQNENVDDVDKKKALVNAVRAVKKLRKLDKLFATIADDDFTKCMQDANKEWVAKAPKKETKTKSVPKCFKGK